MHPVYLLLAFAWYTFAVIINDRIYGKITIKNPLIVELIRSKPMQRLKEISQDGARHFIQPVFDGDRFEHSVGTWYLSAYFNRPIEEQVASLLHDVPHTAFSHVVDFVMEDANQEYHDRFIKELVLNSDIPNICEKYGVNIQNVLRKEDFYLLDNRTPELSFDRWDYFMRDAHMMGLLPQGVVQLILQSVKVRDNQFYFEDTHTAALLCTTSLNVAKLGHVSATSHGSYFLLAEALRIGLRKGIITEQDLFTTDAKVLEKLKSSNEEAIHAFLDRLKVGKEFVLAPKETAEFYGANKARYIDPFVLRDDELCSVSDLVVGLRDEISTLKQQCRFIGVTQL